MILQARAVEGTINQEAIEVLKRQLAGGNVDYRLRALWALHISGNLTEAELISLLSDSEEYVRGWAVQLLCEDKNASKDVVQTPDQLILQR